MKFISLLVIATLSLINISCETTGSNSDGKVESYKKASATGSKTLSKSITVTGTFDGKNIRYRAGSKLGDGSQKEGQKPLFILRPGATLKNVIIDKSGADGVHVYASDGKTTKIINCEWWDVGEDAITVRSGDNDANVLIKDCYFAKAADKVIQINAKPIVLIENCYAIDFERFCRANGTKGSPNHSYRVTIKNTKGKNGRSMLKMSNSKARGWLEKITTENVKELHQMSGGAKVSIKK